MSESVTTIVPLENGDYEVFAPDAESEKEAGEKKYGNVKFADPENSKYPIDTEKHIRAAWDYIHEEKNADKYDAEKLAAMKREIVAAWKDKIDPSGPPESQKDSNMADEKDCADARSDSERLNEFMDAMSKRMDEMNKRFDALDAERKDRERRDTEEKEREEKEREDARRRDAERKDRKDNDRFDTEEKEPERKDGEKDGEYTVRLDKWRKDKERRDAEERERRDRERRDAEEKEREEKEREDARRADAADIAKLKREIDGLRKMLLTQPSDDERGKIADARQRVADVATYFNDAVPTPIPGEDLHSFRRRCLKKYQAHSKEFKDVDLLTLTPGPVFDAVEGAIYRDAQQAARTLPTSTGAMRTRVYTDEAGRRVEEVIGDSPAWMEAFTPAPMGVKFNVKGTAQ